jgi:hypothetical protein
LSFFLFPALQTGVIGDGGFQEGRGADGFLVWLDLRESGARSIVDADMDELPADAAALAIAVTGDAVTNAIKTSGFLDGDVDQPAGIGIFIAAHRLGRFAVLHAAQRFGTRLTVAGDTRRAMGFPGNR